MFIEGLTEDFPNLTPQNHEITSPKKNRYNCIAWAAGCVTRYWWPAPSNNKNVFWPPNVPREETLSAFAAAFATLRYRPCSNGVLELGYEKIALFTKTDLNGVTVPTHAARQLSNGRWTSKLGSLEDIEHRNVEDVSGPRYGHLACFMSRRILDS